MNILKNEYVQISAVALLAVFLAATLAKRKVPVVGAIAAKALSGI